MYKLKLLWSKIVAFFTVVPNVFSEVVIDLETLGTSSGCVVLSIGAVAVRPPHPGKFFGLVGAHPGEIGKTFHIVLSRDDQRRIGMWEDPKTIDWWQEQSNAARLTLDASCCCSEPVVESLKIFNDWMEQFDFETVRVWGNGSDFDNVILSKLYATAGVRLPWKFYNNRCYRTFKGLHRHIKLNRIGVFHNALSDAMSQAVHLLELMREQNG